MKNIILVLFLIISSTPSLTAFADSNISMEQKIIAAEQGDVDLQYELAKMYDYGKGVVQDYEKAAYWYKKAAFNDHIKSQLCLGIFCINGQGTSQDYEYAVYWFRKAAVQNNVKAINYMGLAYGNGEGVEQNDKIAYSWYYLAELKGSKLAKTNREALEKRLSAQDILEAKRIAERANNL